MDGKFTENVGKIAGFLPKNKFWLFKISLFSVLICPLVFCQKNKKITGILPAYEKHLTASKKIGVKILESEKQLNSARKKGKLVNVKDHGKGYKILKLNYSRAVLVPKAKETLRQISADFYKNSKGNSLTYTSFTRTMANQKQLRKVNGNAMEGESSHNFGNSFDVSYVRFNGELKENPRLEKILEKTLKLYEISGKIYFIKEKNQRCFHVTVR